MMDSSVSAKALSRAGAGSKPARFCAWSGGVAASATAAVAVHAATRHETAGRAAGGRSFGENFTGYLLRFRTADTVPGSADPAVPRPSKS